MKRIIIAAFLLPLLLTGQNIPQLPEVLPPSPDVSALGKFVESPVSLATGIPYIDIPIYHINEGEINVPVSLSYHAGGIKVEEVASWVGLGWSLNAGGAVMRIVHGLPDDHDDGYIHTQNTVEGLIAKTESNRELEFLAFNNGERDYEPDVFMYNFNGHNGRFVYDQVNNKFLQTPQTNLLIETLYGAGGAIDGFVITTPEGIQYYFGRKEARTAIDRNANSTTISYANGNSVLQPATPISYNSAWHLLEIVSPRNEKVVFNYRLDYSLHPQYHRTEESIIADPFKLNSATGDQCLVDKYSTTFTAHSSESQYRG